MGIDKALHDKYPSVIINGSRYHYGREPEYGQYLVEHESYAKDYWVFKEKEDLEAFLINLPESADRNLRLKLHPDWREVTPEQREAYFDQDKLLFRAWAAERVKNGSVQSFNMDLEGEHGPHEPQRIESRGKEPPIERVERQLRDWKTCHHWEGALSEAGKLRVLEGELEWTGVTAKDKQAVLAREVDFAKLTSEQFKFVYEDISLDKAEPADPSAAQQLFDRSRGQAETQPVRETTGDLGEPMWADGVRGAKVRELFDTSNRVLFAEMMEKQALDPGIAMRPTSQVREIWMRAADQTWDSFLEDSVFRTNAEIAEALAEFQAKEAALGGDGPVTLIDGLRAAGLFGGGEEPPGADADSPPVRDTTRNLVESIMLDGWPRRGAIVDFGLKSQEHYEALYYPIREGEITPEQLDAALGKGDALTALARSARSNPHKEIAFRTDWDDLPLEVDDAPGGSRDAANGDLVNRARHAAGEPGNEEERGPENDRETERRR